MLDLEVQTILHRLEGMPRFDMFFVGIILSLTLALGISAILNKNHEARGRLFLCGALLINGYATAIHLFIESGTVQYYPILIYTPYPFQFLTAPLLYFYVLSLTEYQWRFHWRNVLQIIPFLVVGVYAAESIVQDGVLKINSLYSAENQNLHFYGLLLLYFHNFIYLFVVSKMIQRFRARVQAAFSDLEGIKLEWLLLLLKTTFVVWLVRVMYAVFIQQGQTGASSFSHYIVPVTVSLGMLLLTIGALRQSTIFNFIQAHGGEPEDLRVPQLKNPKIPKDELERLKRKLEELMISQKPYLDPTLSLRELAELLNQPSYLISQVINTGFGRNFYDFVNGYRVEEAKSRLLNKDFSYLTVLAIAEESGFRSKSVFNAVFKEQTGQTPSHFRRQERPNPPIRTS